MKLRRKMRRGLRGQHFQWQLRGRAGSGFGRAVALQEQQYGPGMEYGSGEPGSRRDRVSADRRNRPLSFGSDCFFYEHRGRRRGGFRNRAVRGTVWRQVLFYV